MSGSMKKCSPAGLGTLLQPLSLSYSWLMHFRAWTYRRGWRKSWRPPAPCISVGNISWGGSGKTPLCEWILNWSLRREILPVMLTRGYKARPAQLPYLVEVQSPVREAGDEPLMIARFCPEARVLVDPKRRRAGRWAAQKLNPGLFVLDDGFQHLSVQRDLDLVLFRQCDLDRQWNRVQPAGSWREGPEALDRASAFAVNISSADIPQSENLIKRRLRPWTKPIFTFSPRIKGIGNKQDYLYLQDISGISYILVTGVGSPQSVREGVCQAMKADPAEHLIYPDHHFYTWKEWQEIEYQARLRQCRIILCTQKDWVKLQQWADHSLYYLDVELDFGPFWGTREPFADWLENKVDSTCQT